MKYVQIVLLFRRILLISIRVDKVALDWLDLRDLQDLQDAMAGMGYPDYLEYKVSKEKLAKVGIQVLQDSKVHVVKLETLVQ